MAQSILSTPKMQLHDPKWSQKYLLIDILENINIQNYFLNHEKKPVEMYKIPGFLNPSCAINFPVTISPLWPQNLTIVHI